MRAVIALAAAILSTAAAASSPDAWKASDARATAACLKASGLTRATVAGRTGFDDRSGQDALLVQGRWPQKHMAGKPGTMLCLYTRATGRALVAEAAGWGVRR
ncbi:MAG: hypothetical protein PGN09_00835 [Sphingomonas fennica]